MLSHLESCCQTDFASTAVLLSPVPYEAPCLGTLSLHLLMSHVRDIAQQWFSNWTSWRRGCCCQHSPCPWVIMWQPGGIWRCCVQHYQLHQIMRWGFLKLLKLILQIRTSTSAQVFFRGVALLLHPIFSNVLLPPNAVRCLPLQGDSFLPTTVSNHKQHQHGFAMRKCHSTGKWLRQPSYQLWGAGRPVGREGEQCTPLQGSPQSRWRCRAACLVHHSRGSRESTASPCHVPEAWWGELAALELSHQLRGAHLILVLVAAVRNLPPPVTHFKTMN